MARVELNTQIQRAPDEVFAYLTDFNCAAQWQDGLLESSSSPQGAVTVGTTIREVRSMPGRRQEFRTPGTARRRMACL